MEDRSRLLPLTKFEPNEFVAMLEEAMVGQKTWNEQFDYRPETIFVGIGSHATGAFYACYEAKEFLRWIKTIMV